MQRIEKSLVSPKWKDVLVSLRRDSETPTVLTEGLRFGVKTAKHPKRVLVVEDNIDSARSTTYLISDMGHQAQYAINGYAGLTIAKAFQPDVILLDLGLPGMDGFEVCRRLKKDPELAHVKVIAITGYAGDEYRRQSEAAGCHTHLVKPVSPKVLEELLEQQLA